MIPVWFYLLLAFVFGSCIGSFLNVVIYRLPRDKSLIYPPSMCPGCEKPIRFYDNIPIFSWLALGGRCRKCRMLITCRYMIVELMTGCLFVLVFVLYFVYGERRFEMGRVIGLEAFNRGGWFFYAVHITLLVSLLAASAIDLELWVIPLSLCWFVTLVGFIGSAVGRCIVGMGPPDPLIIGFYKNFPNVDFASVAALAVGAATGLIVSLILLSAGVIKRSYQQENQPDQTGEIKEKDYNHRHEVLKEIIFLLPVIICSFIVYKVYKSSAGLAENWQHITSIPWVYGLLASVWGYFIGCAIVWATRILGTLAFGREAMGLGDVHLMGAAGAVIGPVFITISFFIAPFFGLAWALYQMFFKKTRQIPYGPFLSMGIFAVMIFHDFFRQYIYHYNLNMPY